MSKLKKEAVGQYNYVAPTPIQDKGGRKRHSYPDFYPHSDVTVEIVDPNNFAFSNLKPPNMFDTSYVDDYRHPPVENFQTQKQKQNIEPKAYSAYVQKTSPTRKRDQNEKQTKSAKVSSVKVSLEEKKRADRITLKSAGEVAPHLPNSFRQAVDFAQRVKSAEHPQRLTENDRINEEFYRSLLKARSGSEWHRKPPVSYDVLNPEKPTMERKTKPYGSQMEKEQEVIAQRKGEKMRGQRPSSVGVLTQSKSEVDKPPPPPPPPPSVKRIGPSGEVESPSVSISRASTASGRSSTRNSRMFVSNEFPSRPMTSSSVSTIGDDYLLETGRHQNETLETIQEEEILEQIQPPAPISSPKMKLSTGQRKRRTKLKKPVPPADLFTKKGPDPRFYASKKNLRTPNEMERFRKARARAFMTNVEQAIPELDHRDHEVKYQPERQLLTDARWKIRKDVKDVRDKNTHSLIDRFEKRHQVIKDETRTRLGDPTYIDRNPVSIYKLKEGNNFGGEPNVGFKVAYPLHNRRRVTPSLGSVQRARNLGSHAQIFNQAVAPPYWGPQKVDHSLFLPPMAQKI